MTTTTTTASPEVSLSRQRKGRSPFAWLGQQARRRPVGAVAGVVCILLILVAILAEAIAPYGASQLFVRDRLKPPSATHTFGTDNLYRDIYSRIVIGSRVTLGVGFAAVLFGTVVGTAVGLISGYAGGWVDLVLNRFMDIIQAFPPLILAIFMISIFRPSFFTVVAAIGIIITPATARIVRGAVLGLKNQQFVEAALSLGSSHSRLMLRHILPNVVAPIIIIASIQIGNAILAEAALSFLSLGIATDAHPSWGKMLQDSRGVWQQAWWTAVMPGAAISLAVLSFNLFGDALRDILDPRLRGS